MSPGHVSIISPPLPLPLIPPLAMQYIAQGLSIFELVEIELDKLLNLLIRNNKQVVESFIQLMEI